MQKGRGRGEVHTKPVQQQVHYIIHVGSILHTCTASSELHISRRKEYVVNSMTLCGGLQ